jgi:hypothetical protein
MLGVSSLQPGGARGRLRQGPQDCSAGVLGPLGAPLLTPHRMSPWKSRQPAWLEPVSRLVVWYTPALGDDGLRVAMQGVLSDGRHMSEPPRLRYEQSEGDVIIESSLQRVRRESRLLQRVSPPRPVPCPLTGRDAGLLGDRARWPPAVLLSDSLDLGENEVLVELHGPGWYPRGSESGKHQLKPHMSILTGRNPALRRPVLSAARSFCDSPTSSSGVPALRGRGPSSSATEVLQRH